MNRKVFVVALALLLLAPASRASAQLLASKDGPIVYGHHHLVVTSVADHKKFWVDTLGGAAVTIGTNNQEIIKFPNALLFMRAMAPSGGSKGTTVNHIGFSVPNLRAVVDKAKANGYKMVTAEEAPAAVKYRTTLAPRVAAMCPGLRMSWVRTTSKSKWSRSRSRPCRS